jgi:hypothetical protein
MCDFSYYSTKLEILIQKFPHQHKVGWQFGLKIIGKKAKHRIRVVKAIVASQRWSFVKMLNPRFIFSFQELRIRYLLSAGNILKALTLVGV